MQKHPKITSIIIGNDQLSKLCAKVLIDSQNPPFALISSTPEAKLFAQTHQLLYFSNYEDYVNSHHSTQPIDYLFSIVNPKILPISALKHAKKLAINYHDALLPKYAGIHATSWSLINNEQEHGITWHTMVEQVDGGEILLQKRFKITNNDTAFSLNLKCHQLAIESFKDLIQQLANDQACHQAQNISERTYYGKKHPLPNAGLIDWNHPAENISCLCRALDFGGQENHLGTAKCMIGNLAYIVCKHELHPSSGKAPGVISKITDDFVQVSTKTKDIRLKKLKDLSGSPTSVKQVVKQFNLHEGELLTQKRQSLTQEEIQQLTDSTQSELFWANQFETPPLQIPFINHQKKHVHSTNILHQTINTETLDSLISENSKYANASLISLSALLAYFYRLNNCNAHAVEFSLSTKNKQVMVPLLTEWVPFNYQINSNENFSKTVKTTKNIYKQVTKHGPYLKDFFYRNPKILQPIFSVGIKISTYDSPHFYCSHAITFQIDNESGEIRIKYYKNIEQAAKKIIQYFYIFLKSLSMQPKEKIKHHNLLDKAMHEKIIVSFNQTLSPRPTNKLLHDLFEENVQKHPNKPAFTFQRETFTYKALNEKSNALAEVISQSSQGSCSAICVYLTRSPDSIISLLAILKSGNAYVPLTDLTPTEQIRSIITDCKPSLIITNNALIKKIKQIPETKDIQVINLSGASQIQASKKTLPTLVKNIKDSSVAYIIYTSGSTGNPKGVQITHKSVVNLMLGMRQVITLSPEDHLLASASFSFDLSIFEIFLTLTNGASFLLTDPETNLTSNNINQLIFDHNITMICTTPSSWQIMVDFGWKTNKKIKIVACGEQLKTKLALQLKKYSNAIWNLYGPTETTMCATHYKVENLHPEYESVPIGKPIENTQAYILDQNMQPVPPEVSGLLYIAGEGLSVGYLNQNTLTKEKFIKNPFDKKAKSFIYNTGDLVKYYEDGNIEYIDRIDNQIKIRGFRVELGSIEASLEKHKSISKAIVLQHSTPLKNISLVAYITLNDKKEIDRKEISEYLTDLLPQYMIPSYFVILLDFPLTSSGKVDLKSLPQPTDRDLARRSKLVLPKTQTQRLLAQIWSKILLIKENDISIKDHFFESGGDSLTAIQVISRINKLFSIHLDIHTLFNSPTIEDLSKLVDSTPTTNENQNFSIDIPRINDNELTPLSFNQERIWFLTKLHQTTAVYNTAEAWKLSGELNYIALNYAILELIKKQAVFRTSFFTNNGKILQKVEPSNSIKFYLVPETLPNNQSTDKIKELLSTYAAKPFQLLKEKPYSFKLFKKNMKEHILFICVHHLLIDGWSMQNLYRQISLYYKCFINNQAPTHTNPTLQYVDFCNWQRTFYKKDNYKNEIEYWSKKLFHIEPLDFPTEYKNPSKPSYEGSSKSFKVPSHLYLELKEFCQSSKITLSSLLLATYALLLSNYCNKKIIFLGMPVAARNTYSLEKIIGPFANTVILKINPTSKSTVSEFLHSVQLETIESQANSNIPFEKVIESIPNANNASQNAFFSAMYSFNKTTKSLSLTNIVAKKIDFHRKYSHLDLTLSFEERGHSLFGSFEYNTDAFNSNLIFSIIRYYLYTLSQLKKYTQKQLSKICILPTEERNTLLNLCCQSSTSTYPKDIIQIFEQQVIRNGNKISIVHNNERISYDELNRKSNQLARYFLDFTKKPNQPIIVYLEQTIQSIVTFLAILKSGNIYVPVDKNTPVNLFSLIITNLKNPIIFSSKELAKKIESITSSLKIKTLLHDEEKSKISLKNEKKLESSLRERSHCAYIIYTSGTTNKPKGVVIKKSSLVNLIFCMLNKINYSEKDILLNITPFNFDLSVPDIYLPLLTGSTIILANTEDRFNPSRIKHIIDSNNVTTLQATPATWKMLVDAKMLPCNKEFKAICGGEMLTTQLAKQLCFSNISIWNFYGPTETTVWATAHKIDHIDPEKPTISIGKPLANTQVYVLNKFMQLSPPNSEGELYIGGEGVSMGYLNNPELNKKHFIQNPLSEDPKDILYRTGDLVRWSKNGELEYIGRIDNQIKINGYRIETSAVEDMISRFPDIKECAVLDKSPKHEHVLTAYITLNAPTNLLSILGFLKENLPSYMIPVKFVVLDKLPLTSNGKTDRKNLPKIKNFDYLQPLSPATPEATNVYEEKISAEIQNILDLKKIDPEINFFNLGLHSLLMVECSARLSEALNTQVNVLDLYTYPTVKLLANFLMEQKYSGKEKYANDTKNRAKAKLMRKIVKKRGADVIGK
jgi:surfactin family lipopeptide synthetase A